MKKTLFLLFIVNSLSSFGQDYTINSKFLKSGAIKIDTIEVQISVYEDKIVTDNFFEHSKCKLSIEFSKNNEIIALENSSKYKYCYRINTFEFDNGKLVNNDERYHLDQSMYPIDGTFEEVKKSYNQNLNSEFLKKYVVELYEKIINYR